MKKLLVLFLAVSMVTFTSCKKDDDSVAKPANTLIGKWKTTTTSDDISDCESKFYMEFTETNAIYHIFYFDNETKTCKENKESSKYTIEGDKIKIMMKNENEREEELSFKFKVSGDTLIIYDGENIDDKTFDLTLKKM